MPHVARPVATRLCLIRHGETDWNVEKRIQGHTDVALNATGRTQALAMAFTAAHQRFEAIYSSDLARALATAEALAAREALSVRTLPALRERHYGCFQGLTAAEAAARHPELHARYLARDPAVDFDGGESLTAFADRVAGAIAWLGRHHPGGTVAAVCHSGVLDIVYRRATGRPLSTPRDFAIPNCALNWFHVDARGWHLDAWGDRHHLSHVLAEAPE